MFNMIRADLFKMYKSSVMKILFGITTLCAGAMTVIANFITQGKLDPGMTGVGFLFSDINMISILGAVIAGVFICGDFDNKTIHDAIACGCSRRTIIVSKAIVFFCGIGFILLPYAIITGIAISNGSEFGMGSVAVGFLNILSKESGIVFSSSVFLKMIVSMLTLMLVYMAQLSICVPLALVLKKPVLVVDICYSISFIIGQLMSLRGCSNMFDNIYAFTPFGGNYSFVTLNTGAGDLVKAISVSLVFIFVMLAATYSVFRKAEIK
ncbi:MAG: ABC transporter permease [Sporomusaceae bacterium]|nr:ABC transporter permease [Sporomusaceae bacterium]